VSRVETLVSFFGDRRPAPAPALPSTPDLSAEQIALVAEACTKSGVVWLRPLDDGRSRLAWHVWHEDAVHVVYGVGEQMLPLLSGHVEVIVPSKDAATRLVTFVAQATVLAPGSDAWTAAATALSAARLNAHDPATQHERWATGSLITRLVPLHVTDEGPGGADAASGAEEPPPSASTTSMLRPWHLGGRAGRGRPHLKDD
jgi:hypothetical protein